MSWVPCTKPGEALQTHSCVASGRSGHSFLGQSHGTGPGTSVCLYSSDNFIWLGKGLCWQDEKEAFIISLMWWVQLYLGNITGSSGKERCRWHHHSLTCKLFRSSYSSNGAFTLPLSFRFCCFIFSSTGAGSTVAPAPHGSSGFHTCLPGTLLGSWWLVLECTTASSKQTCPETSEVWGQL